MDPLTNEYPWYTPIEDTIIFGDGTLGTGNTGGGFSLLKDKEGNILHLKATKADSAKYLDENGKNKN